MDTTTYLMFLALGALMVLIDGQVIYRSGRRYLAGSDDPAASTSMIRMVTVLFHLVTLGLLALLSLVDIGGPPVEVVVGKLGVLLLVLGLVHAGTIALLTRTREQQLTESVTASRAATPGAPTTDPVVAPVPGQHGRDPKVSPGIENRDTGRGSW
ncbi:hypothetical protein [Amycolatopsis cihanbeyliensis]|uniref:Uncharacterized protein n=1 Tax=Amycolatopsis cihanbeyliensis TaxID=1128664 RepID=A0A542DFR7_AMYCI|nr:hypothetical protein [Amycolatopsis cihanbeyliensis]TQJ01871.1 hypothetical protein FB471_1587 [Amycolatopsis cihanbeyliensis]